MEITAVKKYTLFGWQKALFAILGLGALVLFNQYLRPNPSIADLILWCTLSVAMFYVAPGAYFEFRNFLHNRGVLTSKFNFLLIFSAMLVLPFSGALGLNDAFKVRSRFYEDSYIILNDGTRINSTSYFTYVGMTKNYIFVYDINYG